MKLPLRMLTAVACTTLLLVSASSQPRGLRSLLPEERAEQLQELLNLTDAQAANIKKILQTSRKVIEADLEAEEEARFSMRSKTKKIQKQTDQQILDILESKQKEQYVGMRKQRLPELRVQLPNLRGAQRLDTGNIPKSPSGRGPISGPMHLENRPPFGEGIRPETPFPPMMPTFAAEQAGQLQDQLGLMDAQTSKIESLFLRQEKEIRKVRESMQDTLETLHARLFKEQREVDREIVGLLTDEQREKYSQLRSHPPKLPAVEGQAHFDY
jgi:Spy/CpxP family protein refolding chaperone